MNIQDSIQSSQLSSKYKPMSHKPMSPPACAHAQIATTVLNAETTVPAFFFMVLPPRNLFPNNALFGFIIVHNNIFLDLSKMIAFFIVS